MKSRQARISRTSKSYHYWIAAIIAVTLVTASFSMAQENAPRRVTEQVISPDRYIVRLRDDVRDPAATARYLERRHRFAMGQIYRRVLKGFSARMPKVVMRLLERHPAVAYIEPDRKFYAIADTVPTGVSRIGAGPGQTGSSIDVDIAIIDTGIDLDHPDLNVAGSINCARFGGGCQDGGGNDGNGHGTHVSGIAAAKNNDMGVVGVAPGARLWGVRVLDNNGSGWTSWIIAGIDWITAHADTIEVANMSLGGQGFSNAMRDAIRESVNAGVVYVVAAGNDSRDVYGSDGFFGTSDDFVPAAYPEVAAISALVDSDGQAGGFGSDTSRGPDDSFANFSNYSGSETINNPVNSPGKAIDLILPGVNIYSTYLNGQYATSSGTSMASPHAAGLAALYIAQNGRANNANEVYAIRQALINAGVHQASPLGLAVGNDPDPNPEKLGFAQETEPITDLSIASIAAPDPIIAGEPVAIEVTVRNVGTDDVDQEVIVSLTSDNATPNNASDDLTIEEQITETLEAGQSTSLTFRWQWTAGQLNLGYHTLTATFEGYTDDNENNNTNSVEVELKEQGLPNTLHIGDLDGSSRNVFWSIWSATVTMTVHDSDDKPLPGATVYGVFSDGPSVFQCSTGSNGRCSVRGYQWFLNALTFTVTDVYHVDLDYEPSDNHDPDGGSDGTNITVWRP